MIIPAQTLRLLKPIRPFVERAVSYGMTYGLGPSGYDVRIAETIKLGPGEFMLASTIEHFTIPPDMMAFVLDKSTWARQGLSLFNTTFEPGWQGFATLELSNQSAWSTIRIERGMPIAQVIFQRLEAPTEQPYAGRYQDQEAGPQPARFERAR